ncbi:MAG: ATP-binding cassette domain-containing protein [Dehalococcoidia bacterium]|nr:ATP-binding cassette domain-containing protein [Dehalococcoidia bacterium]
MPVPPGNSTDAAIVVRGLTKSYGKVAALRGVDLEVERGIVFGLLGPNGAGKTTLVRILTTLQPPSSGSASVAGFDVQRDAEALRRSIGLAGQFAAVDDQLTGLENLELVARFYHLPRVEARRRARSLIERFDLVEAGDRRAITYSGGMRRRLDLAAALVAEPEVLFLDEPTTGLDPRSRLDLWVAIEELARGGTTVLLTTQYLEEADRLASRIAVVDHGLVIAEGTASELKERVGGRVVAVQVVDAGQLDQTAAVLGRFGDNPHVDTAAHEVSVGVGQDAGVMAEVVRVLDNAGIAIADLAFRQPSLDDVFLSLTGRAAEDADFADVTAAIEGGTR